MNIKYLSLDGIAQFLENIKNKFAQITHTHTKSEISDFPNIPTPVVESRSITSATTLTPADNYIYQMTVSAALTIDCSVTGMTYGSHFIITLGSGGSISLDGYVLHGGDDPSDVTSGDTIEISILNGYAVCAIYT